MSHQGVLSVTQDDGVLCAVTLEIEDEEAVTAMKLAERERQ